MEKRRTVYITAAAITAVGGLAGALGIFFKHRRDNDAILMEQNDQISDVVSDALGAYVVESKSPQIANASTVYAAEGEEFSEVSTAGQPDTHNLINIAANVIRLASKPQQPNDS